MNPATKIRSLRTRVMPNSTMRPSEKHHLHHCSFRSEKNQRTGDKLITLVKKVCCQLSPFSRTLVRADPCANLVRTRNEKIKSRNGKKEQILADFRTDIQKYEFQADSDRRSIQELNGDTESQRRQIDHTLAGDELERQREQILADCQAEIRKHEFQADHDRRCFQKLNEMIRSQKEEIYRAHQGDERLRRDQLLLHEQLSEQNRDLRETHEKSS